MLNHSPTVFVIDPDASVRSHLATLIRRAGWTPETYSSGAEFFARPRRLAPSCLLLELALPDIDGFELQQRVAAERRETPVVVMSSKSDVPSTVRAMKGGAIEVVTKPVSDELLLAAIREAVAQSQSVLQQEEELLEVRQRYDSLSGREREVMAQVVAGFVNKQVSAALGITIITVKAHRGRVMRKMGTNSLAELVRMAMRLHVVTAPAIPKPAFMPRRPTYNRATGLRGRGSSLAVPA